MICTNNGGFIQHVFHGDCINEPDPGRKTRRTGGRHMRKSKKLCNPFSTGGGEEYFAAAQMQNSVSHCVTMCYRTDLTPTHRLVFDGRTLDIEAVLPDERKSRLVIMCTEQV